MSDVDAAPDSMPDARPAAIPADDFSLWTQAADRIRATTKRLEKLAVLVRYLPSLDDASLAIAAHFFSGIVFPRHDQRTTQVGGSIDWAALSELTGLDEAALAEAYGRHDDSGDMVGDVFAGRGKQPSSLSWVAERFAELSSAKGSGARRTLVRETLGMLGPAEARFFTK